MTSPRILRLTNLSVSISLRFVATYQIGDGFGLLSDPSRRAIVMSLADGPRSVGDLAADLPISRPAVSQHLKMLKDSGLVTERAAGTRRIYRLNEAAVAALRDQLDAFWDHTLSGYEAVVNNTANGTGEGA